MDQSLHNNQPLPGQQPQSNNGGPSYNTFVSGVQNYANLNSTTENNDFDFTTGWHSDLFNSNQNDALSSTLRQSSASPAAYAQPAARQAKASPQPTMPQYGQQAQPFINTFQHQPYDSRQFVQPQYDPRFLQRPTQATNPYVGYQYPSNLNFGQSNSPYQPAQSPDLVYPSNQPYASQTPALQARPSQHVPSPYAGQSVHYPYGQQYAPQPSAIQPKLVFANDFSDYYNPQQASAQTVNPSDLSADSRNVGSVPKYQSQLSQNGFPPASSPYFSSPFMQTGQPSMQGQAPPQNSGMPNVGLIRPASVPGQPKKPKDPNAPKKPRGRPRKDGTIPVPKIDGQEVSTTSDSDSEDDNEPPDPKPALLVVSPPTDLIGRATYDAVAAVWSPQNKRPIWGNIIKGMALFADAIKSLRDAWKAKNEALKKAENSNSNNIQELRQDVGRFRTGVETALQRALQFGHEAHLNRLGENVHLLLALNSFLLDRITATDFDGSLVLSILKLMARFSTMTEEVLEQTKVSKILQRLTKKGGTESKELAQKILAKAVVATKKKAAVVKPESPADAVSSSVSKLSVAGQSDLPTGLKRPRDGEGSTVPAPKRVITKIPQSSKPLAVQAAERRRAEAAAQVQAAKSTKLTVNGVQKAAAAGTAPLATNSITLDKLKASTAPPVKPPASLFGSLQSASKKPGTSNADRAAAAKEKPAPVPKADVSSSPILPSKAAPSFSISDFLSDMSKPKEAEPKKVEVLPNESDEQRAKRIRKEARRKLRVSWKPDDSLVETKIFTHDPEEELGQSDNMRRDVDDIGGEGRMLKLHMDKKGLEDEEDEGDELEEYSTPTEVDFSDLPMEERERNFIKASGIMEPESQASAAQEIFEQNTLMVVHALPQDIPPSPKEPSNSSEEDDYQPIAEFGEPTEQTRTRETQRRIASGMQQPANQAPAFDINAIIQGLRSNQAFQQQQQSPNNYGAFQASQPSAPTANALPANLSSIIAAVQQAQQYQASATNPSQGPNLAAALAQFGQPQQQANPYGTLPDETDNNSRKHGRTDSADSYDFYSTKKQKPGASGQRGGGAANAAVAVNGSAGDGEIPYKYKTQVCSFFKEGKCIKGDQCTFIHEA